VGGRVAAVAGVRLHLGEPENDASLGPVGDQEAAEQRRRDGIGRTQQVIGPQELSQSALT
jgi:hypothetical protein